MSTNTSSYTICSAPNVYIFVYILIETRIAPLNGTMGNLPKARLLQKVAYPHICIVSHPHQHAPHTHTHSIIYTSSHTHIYNTLKWNMKYQNLQNTSLCNTQCIIHTFICIIHLIYAHMHLLHAHKHKYIHTHVNL